MISHKSWLILVYLPSRPQAAISLAILNVKLVVVLFLDYQKSGLVVSQSQTLLSLLKLNFSQLKHSFAHLSPDTNCKPDDMSVPISLWSP